MTKSRFDDCIDAAKAALTQFDDEDLAAFINSVFEKQKLYSSGNMNPNAALQKAINESSEDLRRILIDDCATRAENIKKFDTIVNKIKEGVNVSSTIRLSKRNKDYNVEAAARTSHEKIIKTMFGDISEEEMSHFSNREKQNDIAKAFDGKSYTDKESKVIAEALERYFDYTQKELVRSGAMSLAEINPNRYFGNVHDPIKVMNGGAAFTSLSGSPLKNKGVEAVDALPKWKKSILENINVEETFKKTKAIDPDGVVNTQRVDEILNRIFKNITQQRSNLFTKNIVANDIEAIKRKSRMFFVFKDMESYLKYSQDYGSGSIFQDMIRDSRSQANKIGLSDIYGSNPESMFLKVLDSARTIRNGVKPSDEYQSQMLFKNFLGSHHAPVVPVYSTFSRILRTLTSISGLGSLPILSLTDLSLAGLAAMRNGHSFWGGMFDNMKNVFNNPLYAPEEKKYLAKLFKSNLDVHLGHTARFSEMTNLGDAMNKASNSFFKWTGQTALDTGNKMGTMMNVTQNLGRDAVKKFSELDEQTQRQFQLHNITPNEWDALRPHTVRGLFTPDAAEAIDRDALKALWEKEGRAIVSLKDYRNLLYRKISTLITGSADNVILNPQLFERTFTSFNLREGTIEGTVLQSFMQFKSYPMANLRRNFFEAFSDLKSPQRKLMYGIMMMASTFPLSYASQWLSYYIRGLTMPDFNQMSMSEKIEFGVGMVAPGMGIFLNLLDPHKQNQGLLNNLVATRSNRFLGSALSTALSGIAAPFDDQAAKRFKKNAQRTINYISPISTLPFVEPYMRRATNSEPYLEPGQQLQPWAPG